MYDITLKQANEQFVNGLKDEFVSGVLATDFILGISTVFTLCIIIVVLQEMFKKNIK